MFDLFVEGTIKNSDWLLGFGTGAVIGSLLGTILTLCYYNILGL
jgi:hypothetical protein